MSITNLGNQYITFDYKHPATGSAFNTSLREAVKPGLYSGGQISITGANEISIAPFVVYIKTGTLYTDAKLIRIETRSAVTLTITESTPVIALTFTWQDVSENWLDFNQRTSGSAPLTNEICLGECEFTASVITSINTECVTRGLLDEDGNAYVDGDIVSDNTTSGWNAVDETWTYASADSPTFTLTTTGDKTAKYSKGMKIRCDQEQALTGYWTFNSSSATDVGTFTMTDVGTPTYTAGKFGNALTLDGSTDGLAITDDALLHLGSSGAAFTVGMWIKTTKTTIQNLFSSYITSTNLYGLILGVNVQTSGKTCFTTYQGTSAVSFIRIEGTTTVTDGNWHYIIYTFQNNWGQIYVDGKLDASGYLPNPNYAVTPRIRIGCVDVGTGNSEFFNGQIDDLFFINGYVLDEETIKAKYDSQTAQGSSNINITKKFLLTDISYSAPNTTMTLYGGTDFALSNSAITNPYYSMVQQPFGFNRNPDKWSYQIWDYRSLSQTPANNTTAYNMGGVAITVPIGKFELSLKCYGYASNTVDQEITLNIGLATVSNAVASNSLNVFLVIFSTIIGGKFYVKDTIDISVKKTYYLTALNYYTSGTPAMYVFGDRSTTKLIAKSVYI
jgi:hypothetical protein